MLGLSFYLGRKAKSAKGYFAAHGQVGWFVNGIAFAGDYLSAASFLGICGMIAFYGYDGFLYSIGYLAGWIVALFVIAEPIKRLGKFTFADALDSKFNSRGIKLAAAISTLVVSLFYLIPQMVGAGALIKPLLGLPHWAGVIIVGVVVILIVVTAGMVSTTWVQFIKGSLLVIFCFDPDVMILNRGLTGAAERGAVVTTVDGQTLIDGKPRSRRTTCAGRHDARQLPGGKTRDRRRWGRSSICRRSRTATIETCRRRRSRTEPTTFTAGRRRTGAGRCSRPADPTFAGVRSATAVKQARLHLADARALLPAPRRCRTS